MRRPAEQTKLLFLYFLRSTAAALATPRPFASGPPHHALTMVPPLSLFGGNGGTMAGVLPRSRRIGSGSSADASRPVSGTTSGRAFRQASAPEREASPSPSDDAGDDDDNDGDARTHRNGDVPLLKNGHLTFRLARRTDVPQIQKCNLATLPENYNPNFYVNHMRTWPELCLVAEHVPGSDDDDDDDMAMDDADDLRDDVLSSPWEFYSNIEQYPTQRRKKQKEIVGYILGKVEERPVHPPPRHVFPPSRVAGTGNRASPVDPPPLYNLRHPPRSSSSSPPPPTERVGHVTSLAVHTHARRLGIASSLLHQLHYHLRRVHRCRAVGLHVRIGNRAAVMLYVEGMGYHVADIIPAYYGDGEDAYFMRKELCEEGEEEEGTGGDVATGGGDVVAGDGDGGNGTMVHGRKRMRGEKSREEWINKRSTARDRLSVEERGWYDRSRGRANGGSGDGGMHTVGSIGSSSGTSNNGFSGMVQNGFRSLWHHGDGTNPSSVIPGGGSRRFLGGNRALPPWETGPDELRLPRYQKIVTRDEVEDRRSESGKEVVPVGMEVQEVQQSRQ